MDEFEYNPEQRCAGDFLLWLLALIALCGFLGRNALWGSEDRIAEIVRNLLLENRYLPFAVNGVPATDATPATIWPALGAAAMTGRLAEWTLRLPAVATALVVLGGTLQLGRAVFDRETARIAGWLLAGSAGFLFWGRMATPEMTVTAAAMFGAAWYLTREPRRYLTIAVGFLPAALVAAETAGPVGGLLPFLIVAPFLQNNPWRHRELWSRLLPMLAAVLAVELVRRPLPEAAGKMAAGVEILRRWIAPYDQFSDSPFRFPLEFLRLGMPWCLFSAAAAVGLFFGRRKLYRHTRDLLWAVLLVSLAIFAAGGRCWDLLLPILPLMMLATAAAMAGEGHTRWDGRIVFAMRVLLIVISSTAMISILLLPFWQRLFRFSPPTLFLWGLPLTGLATFLVLVVDEQNGAGFARRCGLPPEFAAVLVGWTVFFTGTFGCLIPAWDEVRTGRPFLRSIARPLAEVPVEDWIFWQRGPSPRQLFYLAVPRPVAVAENEEKLVSFLRDRAERRTALLLYGRERDFARLAAAVRAAGRTINQNQPDFREPFWKFENKHNRKLHLWILDPAAVRE